MKLSLIPLVAVVMLSGTAVAQSDDEDKQRGERRGPPEAALEACASSVQGDPCAFDDRRGETLEGTCEAPDDKPLACRPEGGRPDRELKRK